MGKNSIILFMQGKNCELENKAMETIQNVTQREKDKRASISELWGFRPNTIVCVIGVFNGKKWETEKLFEVTDENFPDLMKISQ